MASQVFGWILSWAFLRRNTQGWGKAHRKGEGEQSCCPHRTGNALCPHQPRGRVSWNSGHWVKSSEVYQWTSETQWALDKDLHQQRSEANFRKIQQSPSILTVNQYVKECNSICYCSVTGSCSTLCHPMDCTTPGFPVLHHLPELAQTHVHWVGDAIQPSRSLLSPSPPTFHLSQRQGLFQRVGSSHQVA